MFYLWAVGCEFASKESWAGCVRKTWSTFYFNDFYFRLCLAWVATVVLAISRFEIFLKLRTWFILCSWHAVPFLILFSLLQHSVLPGVLWKDFIVILIFFSYASNKRTITVSFSELCFWRNSGPRPFNPSKWTRKKYGKINKNIFPSIKCPPCLFQAVTIMSWDRRNTILDSTSWCLNRCALPQTKKPEI